MSTSMRPKKQINSSKYIKEEEDSDEDMPLRLQTSAEDSDSDVPVSKQIQRRNNIKENSSEEEEEPEDEKSDEESDEESDENDDMPLSGKKRKQASRSKPKQSQSKADIEGGGEQRWNTLIHKGPKFPEPYTPLPKDVTLRYDGMCLKV